MLQTHQKMEHQYGKCPVLGTHTSGYGPSEQKVDNNESLYSAAPCEQHVCDLQQQNILDRQNYHLMLCVPSSSHQQNLVKNKMTGK